MKIIFSLAKIIFFILLSLKFFDIFLEFYPALFFKKIWDDIFVVPTGLSVFSSLVMARFIFFSERNRNLRKVLSAFFLLLAAALFALMAFFLPFFHPIIESLLSKYSIDILGEFIYYYILFTVLYSLTIPGTIATIISLTIGFFLICKKNKFIIISALSILAIEIVAVILAMDTKTMRFIPAVLNGILGITSIVCLLISLRKNKFVRIAFSTVKIIYIIFFIILLIIFLIDFYNEKKAAGILSISHIKTFEFKDYEDQYYEIKGFAETDSCFQFLFNFVKEIDAKGGSIDIDIVTNAKAIRFDDHVMTPNYDKTKIFNFWRFNSGFKYVVLRPAPDLKKAFFEKRIFPTKTTFKGDFDELNLDALQSFINDTRKEELDKEKLTHTYELYNKDGIKKVVIDYHEKGKWFEIEVL